MGNNGVTFSADQTVKAFLGLKRRQWADKDAYKQMAKDFLEGHGLENVPVQCFKKTKGSTPYFNPDSVNISLGLDNHRVNIIA